MVKGEGAFDKVSIFQYFPEIDRSCIWIRHFNTDRMFSGNGSFDTNFFSSKLNLISSVKFVILLTFTPTSGAISKRVTLGPSEIRLPFAAH